LESEIIVTWRNNKDLADEYNVEYSKSDQSYSNLIDKIKSRVLVKFDIQENDQVVVREIRFFGNQAFDESDLRGEFDETKEAKWWKFWSSAKFDRKKYDEDKDLILKFYKRNGYRDAEILSDSLIYFNDKKDLKIQVYVDEGPQYRIRNIEWVGNTIYPDEALLERLDFAKGDIFNYEKFEQNLRNGSTLLRVIFLITKSSNKIFAVMKNNLMFTHFISTMVISHSILKLLKKKSQKIPLTYLFGSKREINLKLAKLT